MQTECSPLTQYSPVPNVKDELLSVLPKLRAFAISLCGRSGGRIERAEDLVQETVARALANIHSYTPGSNMTGWLYTILRHEFYSDYRKRRREIQDEDGHYAAKLESRPDQEGHVHFLELLDALERLRPEHREALVLVAAAGLSYDEAATLCACPVGTMKSRVSRARARLAVLLAAPNQNPGPAVTWFSKPPANDHATAPRAYSDEAGGSNILMSSSGTAG